MRLLLDWSILWWSLCNGELIDIINYADRDMANAFNVSASSSQYTVYSCVVLLPSTEDCKPIRALEVIHDLNPLPHRVLATFSLIAGGLLRSPEGNFSREKTILMTSLQVL